MHRPVRRESRRTTAGHRNAPLRSSLPKADTHVNFVAIWKHRATVFGVGAPRTALCIATTPPGYVPRSPTTSGISALTAGDAIATVIHPKKTSGMTTGRKLTIAGAVVAGVTVYMAYLGADASWQYSITADECLARALEVQGSRVRVSGKIADGTLRIAPDRTRVDFSLEATNGQLDVICTCPPPDGLADGRDVVVEGRLEGGTLLRGQKVLTRCASKYEAQRPDAAPGGPASSPPEQTP